MELSLDQGGIRRMVYSLYYPETRAIVDQMWGDRPHAMYEQAWERHEDDDLNDRFVEAWVRWSGITIDRGFNYAYPSMGSSEAIKDLIGRTARHHGRIHIFEGEYEGYAYLADAWETTVLRHKRDLRSLANADFREGDAFWTSNPSGIDGEYWDGFDEFVGWLQSKHPGVQVYLDVAYHGVVKFPRPLDLSRHPNIAAVVFSLSKVYGVYSHRIGGVISRRPILTLVGNRYFRNPFSLKLGLRLMREFRVDDLPRKYASAQERAVELLQSQGVLPLNATPCNVVLLARGNSPPLVGTSEERRAFERVPGVFRYNLTPILDALIQGGF